MAPQLSDLPDLRTIALVDPSVYLPMNLVAASPQSATSISDIAIIDFRASMRLPADHLLAPRAARQIPVVLLLHGRHNGRAENCHPDPWQ